VKTRDHRPVEPARGGPLVAFDLDRTLMYSGAALGLAGPDARMPRLVVAEMHNGVPAAFLTRAADAMLQELRTLATVVPTTTRTLAQYRRVRLGDTQPAYAVTTNGARIVVAGRPDGDWAADVAARLAAACAPIEEITRHLEKVCDPLWTTAQRVAEDRFCYLVVSRADLPAAFVPELSAWCDPLGWGVSLQGRKIYIVPRPLTKSAALAEVARRTGATRLLAAGDSLLDADMLEAADVGVRPAHGELHDLGWTRPHVAVTEAAGVLAGEEMVARLLAEVRAP
jgi:hydroxymethylpyrimidine pyrophosphatase-like HAD family hydrolase